MKKSLVALAVLAATGAYAQSSVTLYGIVEATTDIGFNRNVDTRSKVDQIDALGVTTTTFNNTTARQKNNFRVQDGNDQGTGSSRVGFRGTEDLGGGLKANFVLEMSVRVDDGCTTLSATGGPACDNGGNSGVSGGSTFGRNAWGGLSGGFGEVRAGRQVLGSFGVQANSAAAGSSNGLYEVSATQYLPMGGVRFSNAIKYITPNFGGFSANIAVAAPETGVNTAVSPANTASRRTGVDLALEYANGPAYIGFGYNKRDLGNVTSTTIGGSTVNDSPGVVTGYTVGGAYDFGVVKPFINYTRQTTGIAGSTTALPFFASFNGTNASSANARAFSVGVRAPVGAFTVIAGYGRVDTTTNSSSVTKPALSASSLFTNTAQTDKRDSLQLGAQYALSKRTLVEANYGYTKVRTLSTEGAIVNGFIAPTPPNPVVGGARNTFSDSNLRISAFNVGLKHSF